MMAAQLGKLALCKSCNSKCLHSAMENLIKASDNYQAMAKEEEINIDLFNEFMTIITVWDYSCIMRALFKFA